MIEVQHLVREFQDLRQTVEMVVEITTMFCERTLLVPQYVADGEMENKRYHEMLTSDMW